MPDQETKTFPTPSGPVTATTETVETVPREVTLVSPAEIKEFERLALLAWDFLSAHVGHEATLSLEALDGAFGAWQADPGQLFSAQQVEQILGAYLGQRLVADLDMEWVNVTDEYGTDYAVRSRKWEVLSYPFAAVGKRIEDSKRDFLVAVYHTVEHTLKNGDHMPRRT